MPLTLEQLNTASAAEALQLLDGVYEHSPWIAEQALAQRPFRSLAHLKHALAHAVRTASTACTACANSWTSQIGAYAGRG